MIEIHVHQSPALDLKIAEINDRLKDIDLKQDEILDTLDRIQSKIRRVMATQDELLKELGEINLTTDELAADVDALIAKADDPAEKEAVKAQLVSLKTKLQAIASKYTPEELPPTAPENEFRDRDRAAAAKRNV